MAAAPAESADCAYYVYGVAAHRPELADVAGVEGPVFAVEASGLVALVSEVSLTEFGEGAIEERLEELPWLADKVRAHEAVLERSAASGPVLPLRFGTIYRSRESIRGMLQERAAELASTLASIAQRREWGIRAVVDRDEIHRAVEAAEPQLAPPDETTPAGSAFFARKKLEREVETRARTLAGRLAQEAHARLSSSADQAVRDDGALLKAAYLVDERREEEFRKALAEISGELQAYGFRFELTGPWPPYSFVEGVRG